MTDTLQARVAIVEAAMRLAARQPWGDTQLGDIAVEAGVGLDVLRRHFQSKAQILAAFTRMIDDAVLLSIRAEDRAMHRRDRLFDVVMTRFEKMTQYKAAIQSIVESQRFSPSAALAQLGPAVSSQYWMLTGAGAPVDGVRGAVSVKGMTALYARLLNIWLEDSDPGMARTMAALDRGLRRGEDFMRRMDRVAQVGDGILNAIRGATSRRRATSPEPAEPTPAASADKDSFSPAGV